MLDINIFRDNKGGNPEFVRESQRRRFASIDVVDEIIQLDKAWRERQFELEGLRKEFNRINKEVARLKIAREDATELIKSTEENKRQAAEKELEVQAAKAELDAKLGAMGNLVHDSVPVSNDEANNEVVRTWGDRRMEEKLKNHVDLVNLLGIVDLEKDLDQSYTTPPPTPSPATMQIKSKHMPHITAAAALLSDSPSGCRLPPLCWTSEETLALIDSYREKWVY